MRILRAGKLLAAMSLALIGAVSGKVLAADLVPTLVWQAAFDPGSSGYSSAAGLAMDDSGNLYVADDNVTQGPVLVRFSPDGIGSSVYQHGSSFTTTTGLARDSGGNFYLGGYIIGTLGLAVKVPPSGAMDWEYQGQVCMNDTFIYAMAAGPTGRIFGAGLDFCDGYNLMLLEFDTATGDTIWHDSQPSSGEFQEHANDLAVDSSGNLYAVGWWNEEATERMIMVKFDSAGALQWSRTVTAEDTGEDMEGMRVAADPSGNVVIVSIICDHLAPEINGYAIAKYNPAGELIWSMSVSGEFYPKGLATDEAGAIYYCIEKRETPGDVGYTVRKLSASGDEVWTYSGKYSGAGFSDNPQQILVDAAGNVYVAGSTQRAGDSSLFLAKITCIPPRLSTFGMEATVFPNPASGDTFNLALDLTEDAAEVEVQVYNASMQRIFRGVWRDVTVLDGGVTLSGVLSWAPGIYLVRAKAALTGGGEQQFKPVKVKVKR